MSAHSVMGPIQTAVYIALTGSAPFMAIAKAVYDDVPESAAFPYITIGDATELPWDCFGQDGSDATITVHVWSNYRGYAEAQAINAAMIALLDNQTGLSVTGYGLVMLNKEFSSAVRDPDGITRHIATRFRVLADAA